jgi:hypothetical protein
VLVDTSLDKPSLKREKIAYVSRDISCVIIEIAGDIFNHFEQLVVKLTLIPIKLTRSVALLHSNAPCFVILLCLTPDNFTRQDKSAGTQIPI